MFTLLRVAPVITIKQLLSLDIIKAHQNVEAGANPHVAQTHSREQRGVMESMDRQKDEQTDIVLSGLKLWLFWLDLCVCVSVKAFYFT